MEVVAYLSVTDYQKKKIKGRYFVLILQGWIQAD